MSETARWEPVDPAFETRVRSSFARQAAMETLGIRIHSVAPGLVELKMRHDPSLTQQHGFMHAGVISTALDSACGYAAFSLMRPDVAVLTIEFKANLLAPARGDEFRFLGAVLKPGRIITVCEAKAFAVASKGEKLVASMTGTLMAIEEREGLRQ